MKYLYNNYINSNSRKTESRISYFLLLCHRHFFSSNFWSSNPSVCSGVWGNTNTPRWLVSSLLAWRPLNKMHTIYDQNTLGLSKFIQWTFFFKNILYILKEIHKLFTKISFSKMGHVDGTLCTASLLLINLEDILK